MADAGTKQRFKIVDIPEVPETYANQFIAAGFDGSSVSVTLGTSRFVPEKMGEGLKEGSQPQVFVTTRLTISAPAAIEFVTNLTGMLDQIGLMPKGSRVVIKQ
jgi:orotidine-5'-phosphate decarboxylase